MGQFLFSVSCFLILSLSFSMSSVMGSEPAVIRFGALPVLQALPLYVASSKSLFNKEGLNVDIVSFSNAAEKEIAFSTKNIDGYFGDLVTPVVLRANGRDIVMVAANYDTRHDRRMFAVLSKPGANYKSVGDLVDIPVAVSSNSIIDYVTELLLTSAGVPRKSVASLECKNISLRMQMLISGQVEAATLPEPLVTAAQTLGATVLADDSGLAASQTVLAFSGSFVRTRSSEVKAFLRAVSAANELINVNPDAVRAILVESVRLPQFLENTYPVPRFSSLQVPDREAVTSIVQWLRKRGVIGHDLSYGQVVDIGFLP